MKLTDSWHKPTRSGNNGQCVEARFNGDIVEVRNSNNPEAGSVNFTKAEWGTFIDSVTQDNEFQV